MYDYSVDIRNLCVKSPPLLLHHIRQALKLFKDGELDGLGAIVLLDVIPDSDKIWLTKGEIDGVWTRGWYSPRRQNQLPRITLNIAEIRRGLPWALWLTPSPTVLIARVLAHEVGHHLIANGDRAVAELGITGKGKETHFNEEKAATLYSMRVEAEMVKQRRYDLFRRCLESLAMYKYAWGGSHYQDGRYEQAASHFYLAWRLDPYNRTDAWRNYQISRDKSKAEAREHQRQKI
ncbi:MAG: hypothetical protein ACREDR_41660 [Blastocatellia bacterium]